MSVHPELCAVLVQSGSGEVIDRINYSDISETDWGFVYEKHVAQTFASEGWEVELRGLEKGFVDGGIDIVARRGEGENAYIQCKFVHKALGRQAIEQILYKASALLVRVKRTTKLQFWLVVPSIAKSFAAKKGRDGIYRYPMAEYFMSKNKTQSKVTLDIKEIDLHR